LINPIGLSPVASSRVDGGITKQVPALNGPIDTVGNQLAKTLDPGVQISRRIQSIKEAAETHTGLINDALTRLDTGASRFREGVQVAATTTHYSSAEAHGVTDPGQDLGTSGGPMQLVNLVLSQMSQLGAAAVEHQAGHLPGM